MAATPLNRPYTKNPRYKHCDATLNRNRGAQTDNKTGAGTPTAFFARRGHKNWLKWSTQNETSCRRLRRTINCCYWMQTVTWRSDIHLRLHRIHQMQTIAISDHVAWASLSLSRLRAVQKRLKGSTSCLESMKAPEDPRNWVLGGGSQSCPWVHFVWPDPTQYN